jgi:hypothetical protein
MEENKIKLFAKQIKCDEKLAENEVFVEFDVEELLDQIEHKDITAYTKMWYNLISHEEIDLSDFSEEELVTALQNMGFDFISEVDTEDMIDAIESDGYEVTLENVILDQDLDHIDQQMLDQIVNKFHNGSWDEREEMYKNLMVLKDFKL